MKPVLLIVAGPTGSGKTTVTVRLREERWSEGVEYLNPDEVARDRFGDWNDPRAVLQAARWTAARRETLLGQRCGLAFETVFSSDEKIEGALETIPLDAEFADMREIGDQGGASDRARG